MPQRILIADDNPTFRRALRKLLEGADQWEIVEAFNGQEAVAKAVETLPDLVLVDLAMPFKDGFTAAREISQLLPATPILMCTMYMSPHVEREARKYGIHKVFSKSDSSVILPAIRQLLNPPKPTTRDPIPEAVPPPLPEPTPISPPSAPAAAQKTAPADPAPEIPKNVA